MKKILYIISAVVMVSLMACGSRANDEKQKKIADSLFQPERDNALKNANKFLSDSTSSKKDSMAKKK